MSPWWAAGLRLPVSFAKTGYRKLWSLIQYGIIKAL